MRDRRRVLLPKYFYHFVSRGNNRNLLFREQQDYSFFFYMLDRAYKQFPFEISTYCLMSNHFHLQLRTLEANPSKLMASINKNYADYYNKKYDLTGHVFEKRFYAGIILSNQGLLNVSRYIHRNPLEANLVTEQDIYPWSSYFFYQNPNIVPPLYINPQIILSQFPGTDMEQRTAYINYVEEELIES